MKKTIITIILAIVFAFNLNAQSVTTTSFDDFNNYVQVENNIETTCFEINNCTSIFTAKLGKAGFFDTKYTLSLPSILSNSMMKDWDFHKNILHIDEKNLKKLYESLETKTDVKISGAKVYASNKYVSSSTRVKLDVSHKIIQYDPKLNMKNDTVLYIYQLPIGDHPTLEEFWSIKNKEIENLKYIIGKHIK